MELMRELTIAFVMAIVAAKVLEVVKPGLITRTLLWAVSRLVPHEIRQDHYADWRAEVAGIRADPDRQGPFAAARFALGQAPFAIHLLSATRRLKRASDPNYEPWWRWILLILSTPGIVFPAIPFVAGIGFESLTHGDVIAGLLWVGAAAWQAAGAWYIVQGAIARGIPIVLSHQKRSSLARSR